MKNEYPPKKISHILYPQVILNSVNCYVKISWLASFSCAKQFYCWFCLIRVLSRQPEAGSNFSAPRTTFLGGYKAPRGVKIVKFQNFLINCPILTNDGSFFSSQWGEKLLLETFFSKSNIYPSGGGHYPKMGQIDVKMTKSPSVHKNPKEHEFKAYSHSY